MNTVPMTPHEKKTGAIKRHLVQAAGIVGLMTLASRVLGMIRDVVSARQFGTSWQWDAFVFAFMLPNFLRRLVGEGALSSAFIPVYTETLQKDGQERASLFSGIVFTLFGLGLAVFIGGLEVVCQGILWYGKGSERFLFTMDLLRFTFPYLWFISLYSVGMGILNCHKRFAAAAVGPVILDIVWIVGVLCLAPLAGTLPQDQLRILSAAILFSGLLQVLALFPSLKQIDFKYQWSLAWKDPRIQQAWKLLLPSIAGFGIVQLNLLTDQVLAMTLDAGANSSLWYGSRMMQFPLGVFAIAMGTALLPTISEQAVRGDLEGAKKSMSFALRNIFFIILPCAVGLIVLREPIIRMLFERGEFDAASTHRSASVMMYYCLGLFAYSGQKIVATGFYAVQDTKTPVKTSVVTLVLNIILNLILMRYLAESGLALATSITGILQFVVLLWILRRKIKGLPVREIGISFLRVAGASVVMGLLCRALFGVWTDFWPSESLGPLAVRVLGSIGISVVFYLAACYLFGVSELREVREWIRKKKKVPAES